MSQRIRPNKVINNAIPRALQLALQDLKRGTRVIEGALEVAPGHDYWWFLEYGTGPFHVQDPRVKVNAPPSVVGETPVRHAYEISATYKKFLVYVTKGGQIHRRTTTRHPGIRPTFFVRTALFDAEIYMTALLEDMVEYVERENKLLLRADIVRLVNTVLEELLADLQASTPEDSDIDPYHLDRPHTPTLRDAWSVTEAK